jgi:DNA helicase II / ATP-dependent DNA helicase PcrA
MPGTRIVPRTGRPESIGFLVGHHSEDILSVREEEMTAHLNQSQRAAVEHRGSHLLVIAGAGTGKTRMLVHRVASLLNDGHKPHELLMLTFTNSAAIEMRNRAASLTKDADLLTAGTYHAVASRILRRYGHLTGFSNDFVIIDRQEAESLLTRLKKGLSVSKDFPKISTVCSLISEAVNTLTGITDRIQFRYPHVVEFTEGICKLRDDYEACKREHNLMDYDDLLTNLKMLLSDQQARRTICGHLRHILVDEFQDTNLLQAGILRQLSAEGALVTAVGDDCQSIYGFRGADSSVILGFPEEWPGCKVLTLELNYRSMQPVLDAANWIISAAPQRFTKSLQSLVEGGTLPSLHVLPTDAAEGRYVAQRVYSLLHQGTPAEDIAVLFRSTYHALPLEMELNALCVAYTKHGGVKFTESAHVKDLLALLRLAVNAEDRHALGRVLMLLKGIGTKTAESLVKAGTDAFRAQDAKRPGLALLADTIDRLRLAATPSDAFVTALHWYRPHLERLHLDHARRFADLEQIAQQIAGYTSLRKVLDDFVLESTKDAPDEGVTLATIHWAKGREWPHVFIIGLAEGRFPSSRAETAGEYEEERRMLYVAATRAAERLEFTAPASCLSPDRTYRAAEVSSLLAHVPDEILPVIRLKKNACAGALTPHRQAVNQYLVWK